jgi:iron(III) transport system substrate-binding protein
MRLAALGLALVFAGGAPGASAQAASAADAAAISGPDRMQKLAEGAKREGEISLYTSSSVDDMRAITAAFAKKYGVKARIWRGSSEDMLQRVLTEQRAGRFDVDTYETTGTTMEVFQREGLLQRIDTASVDHLTPQAVFPHREWTASRLNIYSSAYNTNAFRKADAPKAWSDLLDPKFKGKLAVEEGSDDWFMSVVTQMGEEQGLRLFRDIAARNGVSVRRGHTLLGNLIASGEVPFSLTAYDNVVERMRKDGAPVEVVYIQTAYALPTGIGVARKAPHPYAAVLFHQFMLTDGQKLYFERGVNPTDTTIKPLPPGVDVQFVNLPEIIDHADKWRRLYRETFAGKR